MDFTHFGHACLLVENDGARVLIDPGAFSSGWQDLTDIDAVLITHQHFDHFDQGGVQTLLQDNPGARLVVEAATAAHCSDRLAERAETVSPGDDLTIAGVDLTIVGGEHATIHADVPRIPNIGLFFPASGFLHPGDELAVPSVEVQILALPVSGPWQRLSDAVDYLRAVAPAVAFPVHEAVLSKPEIWYRYLDALKPAGTDFRVLPPAVPSTVVASPR